MFLPSIDLYQTTRRHTMVKFTVHTCRTSKHTYISFRRIVHQPTRRQTRTTASYAFVVMTLKTFEPIVDDALHRERTEFPEISEQTQNCSRQNGDKKYPKIPCE